MNQSTQFNGAFDDPNTPAQALEVLSCWASPSCATFTPERAAKVFKILAFALPLTPAKLPNRAPSTLREQLIVNAPSEPQSWFWPPIVSPCPTNRWMSEDQQWEFANAREAEKKCGDNYLDINAEAIEQWHAEHNKQRQIQWPIAWADAVLQAKAIIDDKQPSADEVRDMISKFDALEKAGENAANALRQAVSHWRKEMECRGFTAAADPWETAEQQLSAALDAFKQAA